MHKFEKEMYEKLKLKETQHKVRRFHNAFQILRFNHYLRCHFSIDFGLSAFEV